MHPCKALVATLLLASILVVAPTARSMTVVYDFSVRVHSADRVEGVEAGDLVSVSLSFDPSAFITASDGRSGGLIGFIAFGAGELTFFRPASLGVYDDWPMVYDPPDPSPYFSEPPVPLIDG